MQLKPIYYKHTLHKHVNTITRTKRKHLLHCHRNLPFSPLAQTSYVLSAFSIDRSKEYEHKIFSYFYTRMHTHKCTHSKHSIVCTQYMRTHTHTKHMYTKLHTQRKHFLYCHRSLPFSPLVKTLYVFSVFSIDRSKEYELKV